MVVVNLTGKNAYVVIKAAETIASGSGSNDAVLVPKVDSIDLDFGHNINENEVLGKDYKLLSLGAVEATGSFNKKMENGKWAKLCTEWNSGMDPAGTNEITDPTGATHTVQGYIMDFVVNYINATDLNVFATTLAKVNSGAYGTNATAYGDDAIIYRFVFAWTKDSPDVGPSADIIENITLQVRNITIAPDATTIKECIKTLQSEK